MSEKSLNRRAFLRVAAGTTLATLANQNAFVSKPGRPLEGNAIAQAAAGSNSKPVTVRFNVKIPMPDGTNLSADVYRPEGSGKFPTLLSRTYFNNSPVKQAMQYAQKGYAVVFNDVRGRYDSDGKWYPYSNEPRDGYATQSWVGEQQWCNGKIGTFGISYDGFTQVMAAPFHSPYLKCMVPNTSQETNFGLLYSDGVLQLSVILTAGLFFAGRVQQPAGTGVFGGGQPVINFEELFRRLPLITAADDITDAPWIKDWIKHDRFDEYWRSYGIKGKYNDIQAPACLIAGWYDCLLHENWRMFKGLREQGGSREAREGTKIFIGAWAHGAIPWEGLDMSFGPSAGLDLDALHLRWFDYWLKGIKNGIDEDPPIKIFVMGRNVWRSENEWPLARTQWTKYHLESEGKANSLAGNGKLTTSSPSKSASKDTFDYDPENPVPTLGGQIVVFPKLWGPRDRRPVQNRQDVLVYTSEPLSQDLEVTGPVSVKLFAASSAPDTDFTANLTDVYPDGTAVQICEGVIGARFRQSLEHPTLIEPGKVYEYTISLWETSNVFKAGHRIRLEISSSNFPRFARNQNTDKPFGMSTEIRVARQTIHHSAEYPSHLILPIIP